MLNLPSLRRATPVLALLVIALVLCALPKLGPSLSPSAHYEQCKGLASSDPQKALAFAHAWRVSKPDSPMARHCEAIAFYATKDYAHAAQEFDALAKDAGSTNPILAVQLLQQAARSYKAAGDSNAAMNSVAQAKALQPGNMGLNDLSNEISGENPPASSDLQQISPAAGKEQ